MAVRHRKVVLENEESDVEIIPEEEQQALIDNIQKSSTSVNFVFRIIFTSIFGLIGLVFVMSLFFDIFDPMHNLSHHLLFNRIPLAFVIQADFCTALALGMAGAIIMVPAERRVTFITSTHAAFIIAGVASALWSLLIVANIGKRNVPFFFNIFPMVAPAMVCAAWYVDQEITKGDVSVEQLKEKMYNCKSA